MSFNCQCTVNTKCMYAPWESSVWCASLQSWRGTGGQAYPEVCGSLLSNLWNQLTSPWWAGPQNRVSWSLAKDHLLLVLVGHVLPAGLDGRELQSVDQVVHGLHWQEHSSQLLHRYLTPKPPSDLRHPHNLQFFPVLHQYGEWHNNRLGIHFLCILARGTSWINFLKEIE